MPKIDARKIAQLTGHNAAVFALGPSEAPRYFLSAAGDGWVVRWDLEAPETGWLLAKVESQVFALCFLPEANRVVVGNMNGGLHWVDLTDPEQTKNIAHHQKGVFDILPLGPHVLTVGGDGTLTRWDAAAARSLESCQLSNQSLRCLAYCPLRRELAVGASDNGIYLLDADSLELKRRLPQAHDNSVFALRYAPDGQYLLSGGRDAMLKAWALDEAPRLLSEQAAHWYTINNIAFHPEGHLFATASRDRTIKIWDARSFKLLKVLDTIRYGGHINSVNRLLWTDYQGFLISASDDRSMIVWEIA